MFELYIGEVREELKKIKAGSVDLIITDPPYAVLNQGKTGWGLGYKPADWDIFSSEDKFRQFTIDWFTELKKKAKNNSFIFIFWSQKRIKMGQEIFNPDRTIIWRYNNLINNPKGDFAYDYEPIFVIKIGEPKLAKTSRSVLEFAKPQSNFVKDKAIYPTQKPRGLIKHLIDIIDLPKGSTILDCFQGSGVVGEQALLSGHRYIGIDSSTDSELVSRQLLTSASLILDDKIEEAQELAIETSPLSTKEADDRVHYFYVKTKKGQNKTYRRKLSGLWYERDVRLLRRQIEEGEDTLLNEEIK